MGAAAAATAVALGPLPVRAATPRIVVVGAGLAGLTCAHQLVSSGVDVTVHEAGTRVGGRCWTRRGDFASGQIVEHGGELIDQQHTAIRHLAQSLGLDLDNLLAAEANGTEQFNWMGGGAYTYKQATADMKNIWQQLHKDVAAAKYPTLFDSSTPRARELDRMSIVDWIERYVPGGRRSRLGSLLEIAYTIEYGGEASEQSSLNMLYLLAYIGQGRMRILGPSDEKYHVRGGNDQITDRLAAALGDRVRLGSQLESIAREADGTWTLRFVEGTGRVSVRADRVVMAIPFSILRTLDYSMAGFSARKVQAIRELGVGTNAKFHVQFTDRIWVAQGKSGETFSDRGYQNTWEVTPRAARSRGHPRRLHGRALWRHVRGGIRGEPRGAVLRPDQPRDPGLGRGVERPRHDRPLAVAAARARLVLLLEGRAVHVVRRNRGPAGRLVSLRRRAHVGRLPGLPQRRRRDRPACGSGSARRDRVSGARPDVIFMAPRQGSNLRPAVSGIVVVTVQLLLTW